MQATHQVQGYQVGQVLYMALELSLKKWKVCFGDGGGRRRLVTVAAGDRGKVVEQIERAKKALGLPDSAGVRSCYEAGREGFWVHRWLRSVGVDNAVVDSSSIEVNRRAKRAKSDRVDAAKLLELLERYFGGQRRAFSVVREPGVGLEDERRITRERERLIKERTAHRNRIRALLFAQGIGWDKCAAGEAELSALRDWQGQPLGAMLQAELGREWARLTQVQGQLCELQAEQLRRRRCGQGPLYERMRALMRLVAIGEQCAWGLVVEALGWREFANRRQVGACAGLSPTPYASGELRHEQGISKSGPARLRRLMIELGWLWVRHQPQSELSRWYARRFATQGARARRVGIVALARRLFIALWRYLDCGLIPAGARLKPGAVS